MLTRRVAAAVGLMLAAVTSQLPEFTQQYRQRLGGAVDELRALVQEFDGEVARQSLDRQAGLARLGSNPDPLVRDRAADMRATIERAARLDRQEKAFATAGPISQYAVLIEDYDPRIGSQAYASYQPAVPVTTSGIVAGGAGLFAGWAGTHALAWPMRRRRPGRKTAAQSA